eukprot:scaffold94953_cov69-Phaeocystis_antarctica.AAC.2
MARSASTKTASCHGGSSERGAGAAFVPSLATAATPRLDRRSAAHGAWLDSAWCGAAAQRGQARRGTAC